ncbi:unnamed protein product [Thlaspi arvense]|uniref:Serpin domain-containing protein n=1 Tax=Thlaspi arvense TaxID=13288 RepID=A0AAU9RRW9_THLAR|nr:unnamed protein product [Thlaspi arvense]
MNQMDPQAKKQKLSTSEIASPSVSNMELVEKKKTRKQKVDVGKAMREQNDAAMFLTEKVICAVARNSNFVFSPASINAALTMVAATSENETLRSFIFSILGSSSIDELNAVFHEIATVVLADGSESGGPKISAVNGVWMDQSIPLNPSLKDLFENFFKAAFSQVDFQLKREQVRKEVNSWASKHTNGLIESILPPGSVKSDTIWIYGNALYFKGAWEHKFRKPLTNDRDFHLLNGTSVSVPFMRNHRKQYIEAYDGFKVLKLPFRQCGDISRQFSMYFYLPEANDGLDDLVKRMASTRGFLDSHIPSQEVHVGEFRIPKFKIEFGFEASRAFNEWDLEEVSLHQKAFVEIDEDGAEAAAVTACRGGGRGRGPKRIDFVADHPFLFMIREDKTASVLFVGQIFDPSKSASVVNAFTCEKLTSVILIFGLVDSISSLNSDSNLRAKEIKQTCAASSKSNTNKKSRSFSLKDGSQKEEKAKTQQIAIIASPSSVTEIDVGKAMKKQNDVAMFLAGKVISTVARNSNFVFSPASINAVLAMAAASSGSEDVVKDTLSLLRSSSMNELSAVYGEIASVVLADGSMSGGPKIAAVNGVWVEKSLPFSPSSKDLLVNSFKANFAQVDFKSKAEQVRMEVNEWASDHTDGFINNLLPPGSVTRWTEWIYGSAMYFKGAWAHKFSKSMTRDEDFHLLNGTSVSVPFMSSGEKQYIEAYDGFKVLQLPYRQGHDDTNREFSMYFYLPDKKDGLDSLLQQMASTQGFLDRHIPSREVKVGELRIPKFKIEFGFEASKVFDDLELKVSLYQKALIKVDEEGTEAFAAAAFVGRYFGCRYVPMIDFVADHPFLFLIREDQTGTVLFAGQILNPSISSPT